MQMIRRILLPLDSSPHGAKAMDYALSLARMSGASITGLGIVDVAGIESSTGSAPIGGMHYSRELAEQKEAEAYSKIQALKKRVSFECANGNIHYVHMERRGDPVEQLLQESMYYDVVVIGLRSHLRYGAEAHGGETLDILLGETITPIIGVPLDSSVPNGKIHALVAFNGSLPAARALQHFVNRLGNIVGEVTLLTSASKADQASQYLDGAEAYLNAHDITNVNKEWTSDDIIEAVESTYTERADVIVLGAHSKKMFVDFMVGSLAKHVIKEGRKPVFLGQ